ncbi:MAG TPA: hypothetical protein VGR02_01470 [Thermoanaerobaculia bacterium]|jgi:hypothetical protein|nr:hypothetical protein [Thermoanaerobaculia bacterium]
MTMMEALLAPGPAPDIPPEADIYGWLIGSWELEVVHYGKDIREQHVRGEAHFGWALQGRAVQDVWIYTVEGVHATYGTTLRVWDAAIGAWRVTWINPASGKRNELIGRRVGEELVQLGTHPDGTLIRWRFTEMTADSFRWLGEALNADGATWRLEAEFRGRRADR